jgi:stearoyl-CoA desaturase (delta-9 desaturase)
MSLQMNGLIELPWWGYIVVTLVLTHITIASVTIYLHRCQAHRGLDLHPVMAHFFRFWLWFTTATITKAWVAIHRKHHAKCETPEDPHSPQMLGINKVLWQGAELYRAEAVNTATLERYGHGTPDDWLERTLYTPHTYTGIFILLALQVLLFGPIGLTIWAVQMLWIPFFAAGVINGIGHYWGYRNFACEDASTNIVPWGILIGGEELHNNHHAYGSSAKLSNRWYEFDIGWLYILTLELLGLASVKKIAPRIRWGEIKHFCDAELLHAVITHRYDVVTRYAKAIRNITAEELSKVNSNFNNGNLPDMNQLRRWLNLDRADLKANEREALSRVLAKSPQLNTLYQMRQDLTALWSRSTASSEQLVFQMQDWCRKAEESGIEALNQFSLQLRRYA